MTTIIQLANSSGKQSTILEDIFLSVNAITTSLEGEFAHYLESFSPFLYSALQNHEEHQLCLIALGLIGDICHGEQVLPYCDTFMPLLVQTLQNPSLSDKIEVFDTLKIDDLEKKETKLVPTDFGIATGPTPLPFATLMLVSLKLALSFPLASLDMTIVAPALPMTTSEFGAFNEIAC
ncbi:karyopherin Kap95 [Basidiobolus ranarum]|uniref:Karyopherin Kap95 n=1 Tax=Basidiobolus ranarum TaxID=34480 RepID=A0ABR2VPQ9_9FUNG